MLKNEPSRAFYGPKHVMAACEAEAVETLLISDKLFRANNVAERKKAGRIFSPLVESNWFLKYGRYLPVDEAALVLKPVFRIRIHFLRIRIQDFFPQSGSGFRIRIRIPDTDPGNKKPIFLRQNKIFG